MDDAEVVRRAQRQAERRPGRVGRGALVADVAQLRALRHESATRAVFIYDDPKLDNREHAVIRVSDMIPRTDFLEIQLAILAVFQQRRILPTTNI